MKYVLAVDFETLHPFDTDWWTVGLVMATYPDGHVLDTITFAANRDAPEVPPNPFWQRNCLAYNFNRNMSQHSKPVAQVETSVADAIDGLRQRHPELYCISDCPETDIPLLNGILHRCGRPPIASRPGGRFRQTICVWSYRLAMKQLKTPIPRTSGQVSHLLGTLSTPAHVALTDAAIVLQKLFNLFDLSQ